MERPAGIELRGISLMVEGRKPLVKGMDLSVVPGGTTVLTGPSGTGKSILLKTVMGFFVPVAGTVVIGGQVVDASSIWDIRRHMAYVPQEPRIGRGIVDEVLKKPFGYRAAGHRTFDRKQVLDVFSELLLTESHLGSEVRDLSGGERQRVAIALALLLERPVLVLDEPTSALDRESRGAVHRAIRRREGMTVLAASHDEGLFALADTVVDLSMPVEAL